MQGNPPATTGLGLGERLRSARKAKALSVQQVAETLRLEESSVVALEEGRFEAMGAPVFVRGHLRRYAQLVGLSPESVLEAYRAASPGSEAPPSLARPREQADAVRVPSWVWWVAAVVMIVGLAVAMSGGKEEAPAIVPETAVESRPVVTPPAEPVAPAVEPAPADVPPPSATPDPSPTGAVE